AREPSQPPSSRVGSNSRLKSFFLSFSSGWRESTPSLPTWGISWTDFDGENSALTPRGYRRAAATPVTKSSKLKTQTMTTREVSCSRCLSLCDLSVELRPQSKQLQRVFLQDQRPHFVFERDLLEVRQPA